MHHLWWVDGAYLHLASGAPDFKPRNPKDDQFYRIVDVRQPTKPVEVGRWWLPGTRDGDPEPPPARHPKFDAGFRAHNTNVYPRRPDRAWIGYIDGGAIILDISDMAHPRMLSRWDYHPPYPGFTHTLLPLFDAQIMIVSDEATAEGGKDWPKLDWVVDVRDETNPVPLSTFPIPPVGEFAGRGGRYGAHNLHENRPVAVNAVDEKLIFGTYFNGGVRVHDVSDPFRPRRGRLLRPGGAARVPGRGHPDQRRARRRAPRGLRCRSPHRRALPARTRGLTCGGPPGPPRPLWHCRAFLYVGPILASIAPLADRSRGANHEAAWRPSRPSGHRRNPDERHRAWRRPYLLVALVLCWTLR